MKKKYVVYRHGTNHAHEKSNEEILPVAIVEATSAEEAAKLVEVPEDQINLVKYSSTLATTTIAQNSGMCHFQYGQRATAKPLEEVSREDIRIASDGQLP